MKNTILSLLLMISASISAFGQSNYNYQGVLRDDAGELLANSNITVQFDILQDDALGSVTYSESHDLITNDFGEFNAIIGKGAFISGAMNDLDFTEFTYFINTSINGEDMGATEIHAAPVAQTALNAYWDKNAIDEIYYEEDGVIIGSNIADADQLTIVQNNALSTAEMVDFKSNIDLGNNADILNIQTTSTSNEDAQFIECRKGPDAKFQVNVSGDIKTYGEVHSESTGFANLLPIAYGTISASGTILSGTGNFSVIHNVTGDYRITINGINSAYNISITPGFDAGNIYVPNVNQSFGTSIIVMYDVISDNYEDVKFYFTAHKQ